MALQTSGAISFSDLASEFSDSTPNSMSEFYRGGGKVPDAAQNNSIPASGAIRLGQFYNATRRIAVNLTITSNTSSGYNLLTQAQANGYQAGISDINLEISSGVYVGSPSSGTSYALTVSGFTSGDAINVTNYGNIVGAGGTGGTGGVCCASVAPSGGAGGRAILAEYAMTIENYGTVAGGGGGGGGGGACKSHNGTQTGCGASGGGGGAGFAFGDYGNGSSGITGTGQNGGTGGFTSAGAGGPLVVAIGGQQSGSYGGAGGDGGGLGQSGSSGQTSYVNYYDWFAQTGGSGGSAGYYAVGNSNITWSVVGTRLGNVS